MTVTQYQAVLYESGHLPGILAICEAEDWPSLPADPVHHAYRRKGIGRALLEYAAPLTGAQRIDLVTDTARDFYASFEHRSYDGFRIYP